MEMNKEFRGGGGGHGSEQSETVDTPSQSTCLKRLDCSSPSGKGGTFKTAYKSKLGPQDTSISPLPTNPGRHQLNINRSLLLFV